MISDIIFQISVFGDFTSITPSDTTISTMITNFKDYGLLPALFQENNLNLSPDPSLSKFETTSRLSMISVEKKLNVMFASSRIDISKTSADLTAHLMNEDLTVLLDLLRKATEGHSFTRIALNTTSMLSNPSEDIIRKLQPSLAFYSDPNELTVRLNKREDISVGNGSIECANTIITIQKTIGQLLLNNQPVSIDHGILIQFDINTLAENSSSRFSSEQAKGFVSSAEEIRQSILNQLLS
jgi:hypothetical protein